MKKIITASVIILTVLLHTGCASLGGKDANRAARLSNLKTFKPYSGSYVNIRGNITETEMIIYKEKQGGSGVIDTLCFFKEEINNEKTLFYLNVNIQDKEMRFIDSIDMRTDTKITTLTANKDNIKRETTSGRKIFEEIFFPINNETVSDILYCNQIVFQYKGSPVVNITSPNEIYMIKAFFNHGVF